MLVTFDCSSAITVDLERPSVLLLASCSQWHPVESSAKKSQRLIKNFKTMMESNVIKQLCLQCVISTATSTTSGKIAQLQAQQGNSAVFQGVPVRRQAERTTTYFSAEVAGLFYTQI